MFYGKVFDQEAGAVPDAIVNYRALDKFDAPGSTHESKADAGKLFNERYCVSKDGYYMIDAKSKGSFAYGIGPDDTRRPPHASILPRSLFCTKWGPRNH